MNKVIFITGVSGSGKTTIGKLLSEKTGYKFYDADDFHTPHNIEKMKAGIPLTDEDRLPWLDNMHNFAMKKTATENIIVACSALKEVYRQRLANGIEEKCAWIFLNGSYETILQRMQQRKDHYMPASLLKSQFDALEKPGNTIEADIAQTPEEIVKHILEVLNLPT